MRTRHLVPALLAILATSGAAAQTATPSTPAIGRLFMTPEWRAHLERQRLRQLNAKESRSLEGGTLRLDGVVVRSTGKSTIWVNNRPQSDNAQDSGVVAATSPRQPGSAKLATGLEPPTELKVGVTLNQGTRETEGGLADGSIRVNKPATRK